MDTINEFELPKNIRATHNSSEITRNTDIIFLALPVQQVTKIFTTFKINRIDNLFHCIS
jgi:glycerol-3-phosphate dehydrogenase